MADSRQCDNPVAHVFHGWDEQKPDQLSPNVRIYHVCPGLIAPHEFEWSGRFIGGEPMTCAICGDPASMHLETGGNDG